MAQQSPSLSSFAKAFLHLFHEGEHSILDCRKTGITKFFQSKKESIKNEAERTYLSGWIEKSKDSLDQIFNERLHSLILAEVVVNLAEYHSSPTKSKELPLNEQKKEVSEEPPVSEPVKAFGGLSIAAKAKSLNIPGMGMPKRPMSMVIKKSEPMFTSSSELDVDEPSFVPDTMQEKKLPNRVRKPSVTQRDSASRPLASFPGKLRPSVVLKNPLVSTNSNQSQHDDESSPSKASLQPPPKENEHTVPDLPPPPKDNTHTDADLPPPPADAVLPTPPLDLPPPSDPVTEETQEHPTLPELPKDAPPTSAPQSPSRDPPPPARDPPPPAKSEGPVSGVKALQARLFGASQQSTVRPSGAGTGTHETKKEVLSTPPAEDKPTPAKLPPPEPKKEAPQPKKEEPPLTGVKAMQARIAAQQQQSKMLPSASKPPIGPKIGGGGSIRDLQAKLFAKTTAETHEPVEVPHPQPKSSILALQGKLFGGQGAESAPSPDSPSGDDILPPPSFPPSPQSLQAPPFDDDSYPPPPPIDDDDEILPPPDDDDDYPPPPADDDILPPPDDFDDLPPPPPPDF
ncbi:hypothetical protein BLNAU_350 [Blattamonas nauphoetae]|uniref:Uncharacterized protein n=1 Tax=Blattamonas nauphoetae TaxID=2049346 RepID=A0ABQ9YL10_9EUKA|nr:hypothetical protein BLNAU_350 [Blattamonas nauphoetae]